MKKLLLLATCIAILPGCATIFSGTSQNINLMSSTGEQVKAEVTTPAGVQTVQLPSTITVPRGSDDILITVRESANKCYNESSRTVASGFNPLVLLNIVTGGTFGSTTDLASGAFWAYDETVLVPVTKKDANCK